MKIYKKYFLSIGVVSGVLANSMVSISGIAGNSEEEDANTAKYDPITVKDEEFVATEYTYLIQYNLKAYWKHANGSWGGATGGTKITSASVRFKTNENNLIDLDNDEHDQIPFEASGKSAFGVYNSSSKTSDFYTFSYTMPADETINWDEDEYIKYVAFDLDYVKTDKTTKYSGEVSVPLVSVKRVSKIETDDDGTIDFEKSSGRYLIYKYDSFDVTKLGTDEEGSKEKYYHYINMEDIYEETKANISSGAGYQISFHTHNVAPVSLKGKKIESKSETIEFDVIVVSEHLWDNWMNNTLGNYTQATKLQELLVVDGKKLDVSTDGKTEYRINYVKFNDDTKIIEFNLFKRGKLDEDYQNNEIKLKIEIADY